MSANNGEELPLPQSNRPVEHAAGHWILARAGKKVLRPGGLKLTQKMLEKAHLAGKDIVEFAPGLGRTAQIIVAANIKSYTGVDQDPQAVARVQSIVGPKNGRVINADAQDTGLSDQVADVVIGEAMLTMQGEKSKAQIIAEANRLLRPGGVYAIHEMALVPDNIDLYLADALRKRLAQVIRVNARPLTVAEWKTMLEQGGFTVKWVGNAPMALLKPARNIADEGVLGVLRIMRNVLCDKDLRSRMLQMRTTFQQYDKQLAGVAIVAQKN